MSSNKSLINGNVTYVAHRLNKLMLRVIAKGNSFYWHNNKRLVI